MERRHKASTGPAPMTFGNPVYRPVAKAVTQHGSWWCNGKPFAEALRERQQDDWGPFAKLTSLSYAPDFEDQRWAKTPKDEPPPPTYPRLPA
jgi:hypothetical protein